VDGIAKGRHGRRPGLVDGVPLSIDVGGFAGLAERKVLGLGAPSAGGEGLKGGEIYIHGEGVGALQAEQALTQKILGAREFVRQSQLTQQAHQIPRLLASNVQAAVPSVPPPPPPPPPHSEQLPTPPLNVQPPPTNERTPSHSWDQKSQSEKCRQVVTSSFGTPKVP
jgi:hypothetical protein